MSTETLRFIKDREKGVWRWGKREIIYLLLHCHHRNNSCIKAGSDESHFNVSLTVRDKVTRQCPQTTAFEDKRAKMDSNWGPSAYQPNALPLGQIGSCLNEEGMRSLYGYNYIQTESVIKVVKLSVQVLWIWALSCADAMWERAREILSEISAVKSLHLVSVSGALPFSSLYQASHTSGALPFSLSLSV